jgi:molybdenum cofactor cytidylyltransferase
LETPQAANKQIEQTAQSCWWCIVLIVGSVVLAAGNTEYVEKYLSQLNGKTVIERVLDSVEAAPITEMIIVLGGEIDKVVEAIRPKLGKFKIALNLTPELGDVSSFQTGLIVIQNVETAFLVLGDTLIDSAQFASMIKVMEQKADALIISLVNKGKKGNLLLFRKDLFAEILSLASDQTIDDIINAHTDRLLTIEAPF